MAIRSCCPTLIERPLAFRSSSADTLLRFAVLNNHGAVHAPRCWDVNEMEGWEPYDRRERMNRAVAFIVDDENVIASTLELILLSKGFDARSFVDPLDALNAAHSVKPNLLVTDVVMPNMNGIELAIQIRHLHPDCNVLLSSGQIVTSELLAIAELEGHHFEILPKPVHPTILLQKITELLELIRPSADAS